MKQRIFNIKMFPTYDCENIVDEIKMEYIQWGKEINISRNLEDFNRELKSEFQKFDYISHALDINLNLNGIHLVQKGTRYGLFNGKLICMLLPAIYVQIGLQGENGWFMALNENLKWGIPKIECYRSFNTLPFEFEDIIADTNGYFPVKKNGKWGIYNSKGMILDAQYDNAKRICEGLWTVSKNGKWGAVDVFNNIVIPFEYDSLSDYSNGYVQALKASENKVNSVILDHNGKETSFNNNNLQNITYRNGIKIKHSYINDLDYYYVVGPDNEILIPDKKYRFLGNYCEGLFAASLDGKTYGYIDINEKIIIPMEYELERFISAIDKDRYEFKWGIACVKLETKKYFRDWIIINHNNERVFPYALDASSIKHEETEFSSWPSGLGYRYKKHSISVEDIAKYNRGDNMSYLIRKDDDMESRIKQARKDSQEAEPYIWSAKDSWDAMTDGMYGDYPGSDVDYEEFGV